jgi:hypothetical protein
VLVRTWRTTGQKLVGPQRRLGWHSPTRRRGRLPARSSMPLSTSWRAPTLSLSSPSC